MNEVDEKIVIVVVGYAGAGKSTLLGAALSKLSTIRKLVSVTTRTPRAGELDGRDKFFVSDGEYEQQLALGRLVMPTEIYGHRYALRQLDLRGHGVLITEMHFKNISALEAVHSKFRTLCVIPGTVEDVLSRLGKRGESGVEGSKRSHFIRGEDEALRELAALGAFDHVFTNLFDQASKDRFVDVVERMSTL